MKTKEPRLYVVVRHGRDPNQRFINNWLDDERLEAITTPIEIGWFCQDAQQRGESVYIHRCGWGNVPATVCCSASVVRVDSVDKHTSSVRFGNQQVLDVPPIVTPHPGQGFYFEAPPPSVSLFQEILAVLPTATKLAEKVKSMEFQRDDLERERNDYQRCYQECQAAYKELVALHAMDARLSGEIAGMRDHLLTFELDKTGDQLLVHADMEGLSYLASVLSRLAQHAKAGRREHVHLTTKDWSGRELSAVAQDSKCHLLHQVTIYGWTTKRGAKDIMA